MSTLNTNKPKKVYGLPGEHGRFRCRYCGQRFDLSPDEEDDYEEGYFTLEPDTCTDCGVHGNYMTEAEMENEPSFSDADPGL